MLRGVCHLVHVPVNVLRLLLPTKLSLIGFSSAVTHLSSGLYYSASVGESVRGQRNPGGGREEATVYAPGGWVVVLWTEAILHPPSVKYYGRKRVMASFWLKALRVSRSELTAWVMQHPWCYVRISTSIGCIQAAHFSSKNQKLCL